MQTDTEEFFSAPYDLEYEERMAEKIKEGVNSFISSYATKVTSERQIFWNRRFDTSESYIESVEPNRERLRQLIGATDSRLPVRLVTEGIPGQGILIGETLKCTIYRVRWTVLDGLESEGLLLVPKEEIKASAVVIPDADELPEAYAGLQERDGLALRLAEGGTQVLIPQLVNRGTRYSGSDDLTPRNPWRDGGEPVSMWTNQTHREWIHRQGYLMGRHIVGLEAQKVMAAVDWLLDQPDTGHHTRVGVMGYGEGGLIALITAALDDRINVSWVSGHFGPREKLWKEPIYRNIWGLLREFGDAEIASLVIPGKLIIEASAVPSVSEPPPAEEGQSNFGLPGRLSTPSFSDVKREVQRLTGFFPETGQIEPDVKLVPGNRKGADSALSAFAGHLEIQVDLHSRAAVSTALLKPMDDEERQRRVFYNMQGYIQGLIPTADRTRYAFLQGDHSSPESWDRDMEPYRKQFYEELIGKIPEDLLPMNPRMRQIFDEPGWKGYEVILDVWPDVYSWGILAVPDDIEPGESRPAVVMQHGVHGLPSTPIRVRSYYEVLPALVNRGFVVFSPHNPYHFNIRKANAVKASVFSVIIPQHQQILNFLDSLEYVDGNRIALYGKSFGGRAAQNIPIVLKQYKATISSAYFNNWIQKAVRPNFRNSYFFANEVGIYKWNMGHTFTHAEMGALLAPRPFMVESGYRDWVAHEMVAHEFEKVRRLYSSMGISDRVELEFFMGGHDINGVGTFQFLHKHLDWAAPESPTNAQQISQ